MKASISKQTAEGEAIVIEVSGKDGQDLAARISEAMAVTDARLLEMNQRIMRGHTYLKSLPLEIRGQVSQAVNAYYEILYGQMSPATKAALAQAQAQETPANGQPAEVAG